MNWMFGLRSAELARTAGAWASCNVDIPPIRPFHRQRLANLSGLAWDTWELQIPGATLSHTGHWHWHWHWQHRISLLLSASVLEASASSASARPLRPLSARYALSLLLLLLLHVC